MSCWAASVMVIAIVAADDWMIAVSIIAENATSSTSNTPLAVIEVKIFAISGLFLIGETPLDMK